jgi:hypothetical protein
MYCVCFVLVGARIAEGRYKTISRNSCNVISRISFHFDHCLRFYVDEYMELI